MSVIKSVRQRLEMALNESPSEKEGKWNQTRKGRR